MQVTCLHFPRLELELVYRKRPTLRGRPVLVIDGVGESAQVVARSPEVADTGVLRGMPAGRARRLAPFAVFVPGDPARARERMALVAEGLLARGLVTACEVMDDHVLAYSSHAAAVDAACLAGVARAIGDVPVRVATADTAREARDHARLCRGVGRITAAG